MTTQAGLQEVFIRNVKCPLVAHMVRKLLYERLKHSIPEAEFKREFIHFRDTFEYQGMKVLHLVEGSVHRYVLTDNKFHISNHNAHLKRVQRRAEKRKVAI